MSARPSHDQELLALVHEALASGPTRAPAALRDAIAADVAAHPRTADPLRRLRRDAMPVGTRPFAGVPATTALLALLLLAAGSALVAGAFVRLTNPPPPRLIPGDLWITTGMNIPQLTPVDTTRLEIDRDALSCGTGERYGATPLCSKYVAAYAWSPDGGTLAFLYRGGATAAGGGDIVGAPDGLYRFRDGDEAPTHLAGCETVSCDDFATITWTRDGAAVAVTTPGSGDSLILLDPTTGTVMETLIRPAAAPEAGWMTLSISPRGDRLAWATESGTFIGDLDGTDAVKLTDARLPGISWSADGSRIAYAHTVDGPGRGASPGRPYAYVVTVADADGRNAREVWSRPDCCHGGGWGSRAAISPDGTRVAVVVYDSLTVIDVASQTASTVRGSIWAVGYHPAWRP